MLRALKRWYECMYALFDVGIRVMCVPYYLYVVLHTMPYALCTVEKHVLEKQLKTRKHCYLCNLYVFTTSAKPSIPTKSPRTP